MKDIREIKWLRLDNADGTATLKQHAFIPKVRKRKYTGEEYIGNISLCGRIVCGNENEEIEEFDLVESEPMRDDACVVCKRKTLTKNETNRYEREEATALRLLRHSNS